MPFEEMSKSTFSINSYIEFVMERQENPTIKNKNKKTTKLPGIIPSRQINLKTDTYAFDYNAIPLFVRLQMRLS